MSTGQRFWSPILLSDWYDEGFTSAGDEWVADTRKLLNPNRGPMLIDQFRFSVPTIDELLRGGNTVALSKVAAEIKIGSIPLMSAPVTLGAFVPRYIGQYDTLLQRAVGTVGGFVDWTLTWHLAKPIYVPQDVSVSVRLVRQRVFANAGNDTGTCPSGPIRVTIAGRSLPENEPNPEKIWVPWVSETKAAQTESSEFLSKDSDLINPHPEPLNIKMLCGINLPEQSATGDHYSTYADLRVQMTASNGTAIVRDRVPFGILFPIDRGALEVDAYLQPGEFIRCALDIPEVPPGADAQEARVQFTAIGMTGYRQIPCPRANR